jgi:membrane protein YqaA with SNARE-associated domain
MLDIVDSLFASIGVTFADSALWMMLITGFLSATLLPGGSEAALIAVLKLDSEPLILVILVATFGNTLGGAVNYLIGLWIPNRTHQQKHGHRSLAWLQKYGYWALLFSWLPIIGDALCLAAGWLRMKFIPSFTLILIGKAVRYSMLAALFYGFF